MKDCKGGGEELGDCEGGAGETEDCKWGGEELEEWEWEGGNIQGNESGIISFWSLTPIGLIQNKSNSLRNILILWFFSLLQISNLPGENWMMELEN